mgnify:CR=1 FL=1
MLFRKMLRDIRENLVSYIACIAIIALGLMTYVSMANVKDILVGAKDRYYLDYRFADAFAVVNAIPEGKTGTLARIPGIRAVEPSIVRDVRVLLPGRTDNVYLRLVSFDTENPNRLNDLWQLEGTPLGKGDRSILLGVEFYNLNGFSVGDAITLVINGRKETLSVAGKGQTPEFIYAMKNATDFMPAGASFGTAFVPKDTLQALLGSGSSCNRIAFAFDAGTTWDDVKDDLKSALRPYALQMLFPRKDQISNLMLDSELKQLSNFATSAPLLFLTISTIILWIMLKRMVEHQRTQIGMLKAAGYTAWEVLRHYLSFALFVGVLGGVLGNLGGFALSGYMVDMYGDFFTLPGLINRFSRGYFLTGMLLSVGFSLMAGFLGAKGVLRLSPAVAMQPPAPHSGKSIPIERIRPVWNALTVQGRMAMRNLWRSPARSLFTLSGVAMSFALMAAIFTFTDLFDVFVMDQFRYVQHFDLKASFLAPMERNAAVSELARMDGVQLAEPLLEVPVVLSKAHRSKSTILIANAPDARLYTVVGEGNRPVAMPDDGIILSIPLAEKLEASVGDILELESPYQRQKDLKVAVCAIIPQYISQNAYMSQSAIDELLGQGGLATSVLLSVAPGQREALKDILSDGRTLAGIDDIAQMKQGYYDLMDQFFFMLWIMVGMVVLVGFAIVYNSSIISLSERERELASLRVLGMDLHEVQEVVSFEQGVLAAAGIVLGVPLTYWMYATMADTMQTDLYRIPIIINARMFLYALLGTAGSMLLAYLNIRRRLRRLDMVEVLKARE